MQLPSIVLVGNFNFPNLLCEGGIGSVDSNPTYGPEVNHLFIETINDYGLEQLVTQPTRENHILDLVLSTHPGMLHDLEVVPGISDHEAITFQLNLGVIKPPSNNLHKVYQYHKANTIELIFSKYFLTNNPYEQTVENNWQQLKDILLELVEKHVPHKIINPHKNLPWLSKRIKCLMKQRKRLYDHAKCTQHSGD